MLNKEPINKRIDHKIIDKLLFELSLGNMESFHNLYELTKTSVYGYSLSLLKNHNDALDNMQDVYVKIHENINSYKSNQTPMSWILTITKNLALMKIRKQKKIVSGEINEEIFVNDCLKEEDKIFLREILEKLSEEERQIVLFHLVAELKHKEIAELLELKLSTTLSKYHRALKKIRNEWGNS